VFRLFFNQQLITKGAVLLAHPVYIHMHMRKITKRYIIAWSLTACWQWSIHGSTSGNGWLHGTRHCEQTYDRNVNAKQLTYWTYSKLQLFIHIGRESLSVESRSRQEDLSPKLSDSNLVYQTLIFFIAKKLL